MKKIILLVLLATSRFAFAQEQLINVADIENSEGRLIRAIEKFQKKANKERLKEDFISEYKKFFDEHQTKLNIASKSDQYGAKNWEGILNEMRTLQYIGVRVKASPTTAFVTVRDYSAAMDSVANLAAKQLYEAGKNTISKAQYEAAYRYLNRLSAIYPNYLNTDELLKQSIDKGTKNVFFAPVGYDNLGNFMEWASKKSSASSDFILGHIINDLSVNNIGANLQNQNDSDADWIVSIKWTAINIAPERTQKYERQRSAKIKEKGSEVTVNATVNYIERSRMISGNLSCNIFNKKNGASVTTKNFNGSTTLFKTEATYKGDNRALTSEDQRAVNETRTFSFGNDGYELTTKMYKDVIHHQLINYIGPYLNWNYKPVNVPFTYQPSFRN